MFDFIRGKVANIGNDFVVVDVNGVGFKIYTSLTSLGNVSLGDEETFYTSLCVSEDDMRLFGYLTEDERGLYELLVTVSGVGPKVANTILSQISVRDLTLAIAGGNDKAISKAKGIGPKLAQKIVIELKDKISGFAISSGESIGENVTPSQAFFGKDDVYEEAVAALVAMGYNEQKARSNVSNVYKPGMTTQEVFKLALKG